MTRLHHESSRQGDDEALADAIKIRDDRAKFAEMHSEIDHLRAENHRLRHIVSASELGGTSERGGFPPSAPAATTTYYSPNQPKSWR